MELPPPIFIALINVRKNFIVKSNGLNCRGKEVKSLQYVLSGSTLYVLLMFGSFYTLIILEGLDDFFSNKEGESY